MNYILYKAIMFNDTSSILWLSTSFFLKMKNWSRLSTGYQIQGKITTKKIYFQFHQEKARCFYMQQVVYSMIHGFGPAEENNTCYISKLQAIHDMFPKTLSESKNIPYTVCCTELWPKSQYNLEHYGLSNKIVQFFFLLELCKKP